MLDTLLRRREPVAHLHEQRTRYLARGGIPAPLARLLQTPLPPTTTPLQALDILALDIETTGLDPEQDHILSVGLVPVHQGRIDLRAARRFFVHGPYVVKASTAIINQITPEMLENGQPLDWVMEELFAAMQGHVLLCHGATVEQRFINAYLQQTFGLRDLPLPWLDTLALERNRSAHKGAEHNDFRLSSVRARQGLPPYPAHDALTDAVATAELLLSLAKTLFADTTPTLGGLLRQHGSFRPLP